MSWKYNRKHLHASVSAATLYGMLIGWWIGARMGVAVWYEVLAFVLASMIAPAVVFSRIDKKHLPPAD